MNACSAGWTLFVLALASAPARAGTIRGTLHVPAALVKQTRPLNPYPGRAGALPLAHAHERGSVIDAVVYLEDIPARAESALARDGRHALAQKDQAFVPRVLPVARGTAVDFPNLDPIYHNVFSVSPVKRFDLGKYPKGSSKRVLFNKTGLVNVYCDIHSDMEAFVLVLPHHAFVQPGADGAFALPELPPGAYTVKVWHPDLGELHRSVQVPPSGEAIVELSY